MDTNSAICVRLSEYANSRRAAHGTDTLYHFLCVHHNICARLASHPDASVRAVNQYNVEAFLKVYGDLEAHRAQNIPDAWRRAFFYCRRNPNRLHRGLLRLAKAHIRTDIRSALLENNIDAETFKIIFEEIKAAVDESLEELRLRHTRWYRTVLGLAEHTGLYLIVVERHMAKRRAQQDRSIASELNVPKNPLGGAT